MLEKINTFSANSLKTLDKSLDEFIDVYEYNLKLFKKDSRADLGQKYHNLICAYIKGFDIEKMKKELDEEKIKVFDNFIKTIEKDKFIKTEYPFLIKDELNKKPYYLTGRFDAIYKDKEGYTIYDWKTVNIPKDPQDDLQSIVYLYCASKIFESENIKMKYVTIEKSDYVEVEYKKGLKEKIDSVIAKYYKN